MSTVYNPGSRPIMACIENVWFEVPANGKLDDVSAFVATTLVEYGATMTPGEHADALHEASDRNRDANSRYASASQSEGTIIKTQATMDTISGGVDTGEGNADNELGILRGAQLAEAVKVANLNGANIGRVGADEQRRLLAEHATRETGSTDPAVAKADAVDYDELDDDGLIAEVERRNDGKVEGDPGWLSYDGDRDEVIARLRAADAESAVGASDQPGSEPVTGEQPGDGGTEHDAQS